MNFKKREKGDKKKNTVVIAAALLLFLVIAGGMIYRQIQGHQVKEAWAERLERGEERRARKAAEAEEAMAESEGVLDFSMVGVLARISALMADNGIGIFAVSTYNTDYILTKKENYEKALAVLAQAGYKII